METQTIQFLFSDNTNNQNSLRYWNEKLKQKIAKCQESNFVFTNGGNQIKQWELVHGKELKHVKTFDMYTPNVVFDEQNNELLYHNGQAIVIHNLDYNQKHVLPSGKDENYITLHLVKDKRLLIVKCYAYIEIWDWKTKQLIVQSKDFSYLVQAPQGNELLHLGRGFTSIRSLETFQITKRYDFHGHSGCIVGKKQDLIAMGNYYCVKIYNKQTGNTYLNNLVIRPSAKMLYSLKLDLLISVGGNGTTVFFEAWRMATLEHDDLCFELKLSEECFSGSTMAFLDADQTSVIVGTGVGDLFIIDLILKKATWKLEKAHSSQITSVFA